MTYLNTLEENLERLAEVRRQISLYERNDDFHFLKLMLERDDLVEKTKGKSTLSVDDANESMRNSMLY